MNKQHHHIYRYRFGLRQFFNLLIGLGLLGGSISLLTQFKADNTLIVIASFLAGVGLTPILLTTNYLTKSLGTEIRIDDDKGLFEIIRKGKRETFKLGDVASLDIQEQRSTGLYGFDFDFAKYTFADGKYCIVTNMMTDDYYIPSGVQPRTKRTIFPIIWHSTNV